MPLAIGQEFWFAPNRQPWLPRVSDRNTRAPESYAIRVDKIGSKYVYLKPVEGRTHVCVRLHKEGLRASTDDGKFEYGEVFESKAAYEEEIERHAGWHAIRTFFRENYSGLPKRITTLEIRTIKGILEIK